MLAVTYQLNLASKFQHMPTEYQDNELIQQVLGGNQQAYAGLVERYQNYVFTLALRIVKTREDAEEVAQDVFVKAYRSLSDFKGTARFSTWLYTIVNNTSLSFLRKKRLETHSLDDDKVFELADRQESSMPAHQYEAKSKSKMLAAAIAMLGEDDAEVITLFYQAEQSLDEIARILRVETNTAKVRLHRARGRLKEKLEKHFSRELRDAVSG